MHKVFKQRRDQKQQYPGAERAPDEKPIQRNGWAGQQAFQYAGQVIGDGVRGEPDAHHDGGGGPEHDGDEEITSSSQMPPHGREARWRNSWYSILRSAVWTRRVFQSWR